MYIYAGCKAFSPYQLSTPLRPGNISLCCSWEKWGLEMVSPWPVWPSSRKQAELWTCVWLSWFSSFLKALFHSCNIFLLPSLQCTFPLISCCSLLFILFSFTSEPETSSFRPNVSCLDVTESWVVILSTNCGRLFAFLWPREPAGCEGDLFTPGRMGQCRGPFLLLNSADKHLFHFLLGTLNGKLF